MKPQDKLIALMEMKSKVLRRALEELDDRTACPFFNIGIADCPYNLW